MDDWGDFQSMPFRERSNTWPSCVQKDLEVSSTPTIPDVAEVCSVFQTVKIPVVARKKKRRKISGNKSYAELITDAILSTEKKRMTLSQIYNWMVKNVDCFSDNIADKSSATWKNSIRYNLSRHENFMKPPNEQEGKNRWWVLNPNAKSSKMQQNLTMGTDQSDVPFRNRSKECSFSRRPYTSESEIQEADKIVNSLIEALKLKEGLNQCSFSEEHTEEHGKPSIGQGNDSSWWSLNPNVTCSEMVQNPIMDTDQLDWPFRRRTQSDCSSYRYPSPPNSPNCNGISYSSDFEIQEAHITMNSLNEAFKLQEDFSHCSLSGEHTETHLKPPIEHVNERSWCSLNPDLRSGKMTQSSIMGTDQSDEPFRRRTQSDCSSYRRPSQSTSGKNSLNCIGNSFTSGFETQVSNTNLDTITDALKIQSLGNYSLSDEHTETHLKPSIDQVSEILWWNLVPEEKPSKVSQNDSMGIDQLDNNFHRRAQTDGPFNRCLSPPSSSTYSLNCSGIYSEFEK